MMILPPGYCHSLAVGCEIVLGLLGGKQQGIITHIRLVMECSVMRLPCRKKGIVAHILLVSVVGCNGRNNGQSHSLSAVNGHGLVGRKR